MKIDLTKLIYSNLYRIPVDSVFDIPKDYLKNTDMRDISPVKVTGYVSNNEEEYELNINVSGEMILPCARTLKDVKYPFSIDIIEPIGENNENSLEIVQNSIDIFPIIWKYILMDVPLRVLHPDAKDFHIEGEGWHLITEDDKKEVIDPRLAKLKDYIKE